jgi:hypothetical protein
VSNIILAIVLLLTLITLPHLMSAHLPIALFRGIGRGIYWNARHIYNVKELTISERSSLINFVFSINTVLGVLFPFLIGAFITELGITGYQWTFIAGIVVYVLAAIYPWRFNKKSEDRFRVKDVVALRKRKGFNQWAILTMGHEVLNNQRELIILVLPFLFIGDEFGVGVLASGVGLAGAFFAFNRRNDSIKKKLQWGVFSGGIITAITLLLVWIWNLPMLVIRSLVVRVADAAYLPVLEEEMYQVRAGVIRDHVDELGVESQQAAEFFLFLARMFNLTLFLVLFYSMNWDQDSILRMLLAVSAVREIPILLLHSKLSDYLKVGGSQRAVRALGSRKNEGYAVLPT